MTFMPRIAQSLLALSAVSVASIFGPASAAQIHALHRFSDTGNSTPSHYALGSTPYSELFQASDGNFYGTTVYGGSGLCPNNGAGGYLGCGTVFRMAPSGTVTTLYSFPYETSTSTAPDGAFPTAGLIQGKDGYLYGVAQDGGIARCNGALGCGTMFRISTAGDFTLLHQFCSGDGCGNTGEGGRPLAHLVQRANGSLCGTASEGGFENEGTLFCASRSGAISTLYTFQYENGTDGYYPTGALLVGADGSTLYGTTTFGGVNGGSAGGGIVFALKGARMTILHAFDNYHSGDAGTYYQPMGALIFGADGKLYGTTYAGGTGGCIFSLNTDGTDFSARNVFTQASNVPNSPAAGLVLASNGLMYGTTLFGSIEMGFGQDSGVVYSYNPINGAFKALADFNATVGATPRAALIEGADGYLYTSASAYGGSNNRGQDSGTLVRLVPALKN